MEKIRHVSITSVIIDHHSKLISIKHPASNSFPFKHGLINCPGGRLDVKIRKAHFTFNETRIEKSNVRWMVIIKGKWKVEIEPKD